MCCVDDKKAMTACECGRDHTDGLRFSGIGGTSGRAIIALLGWYGLGGPEAAEERLARFRSANCAAAPAEQHRHTSPRPPGGNEL